MRYSQVAYAYDAEGKPVLAAWAYELALAGEPASLELRLNLIALYALSSDPGFAASHHLDVHFVDLAFFRAKELLAAGLYLHPGHPELIAWNEHIEERVLGRPVDETLLEEIAVDPRAEFARLLININSGGQQFRDSAQRLFERAKLGHTERDRHYLSYAPDSVARGTENV